MGRFVGRRPNWKKAIVTLAAGPEHRVLRGSLEPWVFDNYKPTTPGRRGTRLAGLLRAHAGQRAREALLDRASRRTGGRNNYGRITSRFRGGGHKRRYRVIDFKRDKIGVPAKVAAIEYDPEPHRRASRSCTTPTARSATSSRPTACKVGDTVISARNADIKPGNSLPLRFIPLGTDDPQRRAQDRRRRPARAARPASARS